MKRVDTFSEDFPTHEEACHAAATLTGNGWRYVSLHWERPGHWRLKMEKDQ